MVEPPAPPRSERLRAFVRRDRRRLVHRRGADPAALPADRRRGLLHLARGVDVGRGRRVFEARVAATIRTIGVPIGVPPRQAAVRAGAGKGGGDGE